MRLVCTAPGAWALQKEAAFIGRAQLCGGRFLCFEVDARWRGRGYGAWFYRQVLRAAGLGPADALTAAPPADDAARAFLARRGFAPDAAGVWHKAPVPRHTGSSALAVVHAFWRAHLHPGAFAVDATAGNGHDTLLLCRLVGPSGRVLAMDIQPRAVAATNARLAAAGLSGTGRAVLASHAGLAAWAAPGSADAVVFNLGYLPGAAHGVYTRPDTTLPALDAAAAALRSGGFLTVCAYWGPPQGGAERAAVLAWADALPAEGFWVRRFLFKGQPGHPPAALCIRKR